MMFFLPAVLHFYSGIAFIRLESRKPLFFAHFPDSACSLQCSLKGIGKRRFTEPGRLADSVLHKLNHIFPSDEKVTEKHKICNKPLGVSVFSPSAHYAWKLVLLRDKMCFSPVGDGIKCICLEIRLLRRWSATRFGGSGFLRNCVDGLNYTDYFFSGGGSWETIL